MLPEMAAALYDLQIQLLRACASIEVCDPPLQAGCRGELISSAKYQAASLGWLLLPGCMRKVAPAAQGPGTDPACM